MVEIVLTNDSKQFNTILLDTGKSVSFNVWFCEMQRGWFYTAIYETIFSNYNRRIVTSPNMLRQFREIIPFGISCITTDGQEPIFKDDFKNKRAKVYFLNSADILTAEEIIAQ